MTADFMVKSKRNSSTTRTRGEYTNRGGSGFGIFDQLTSKRSSNAGAGKLVNLEIHNHKPGMKAAANRRI